MKRRLLQQGSGLNHNSAMRTVLRILWMALVLLIVALLSALTTMRLAIHGREVTVPDFKGKTPAEARRIAEDTPASPCKSSENISVH